MSMYRWEITVRRWNLYGDRVVSKTPVTIVAATKSEVTEQVIAAFEATYDTFRKFWSHDWTLTTLTAIEDPIEATR